jgi:hypothetical protein
MTSNTAHLRQTSEMRRRIFIALTTGVLPSLSLTGCGKEQAPTKLSPTEPEDPPVQEFVFVPGPGFEVRLTIDVPARVRVGQAVRLRARRESIGEWRRVKASTLPADALFFTEPGPGAEAEVAATLSWFTDPPRVMTGDSGLRSLALGMEREAIFKASGLVQVWAMTAIPMRQKSNVVQVQVAD